MAPVSQFEAKPAPGDMVGSVKFAPNSSSRIIASCWDARVYLYEIQGQGEEAHASLVREFPHKAAVLDVCFGKDDDEAFSTDLNKQINRIDLATGEQIVIGHHEKPAPRIAYSREHSILISASWDGSIHFYNANDFDQAPIKAQLPGKAQALAASPSKVVVAMNARLVHIYDLPTVASILNGKSASELTPWQQRESSLKFLTRAVACMPNDAGYATSSIEGRVAVEWFEDSAESQARKYAFKCHRQTAPEEEGGGDIVFPVNALAFHPRYGTFASGGGDGTVALWDAEAKRRMKVYQKIPNSVWALAFSNDGKYLAMSVAPGFETGQEDYSGEGQSQILIRELGETEARGKGAK